MLLVYFVVGQGSTPDTSGRVASWFKHGNTRTLFGSFVSARTLRCKCSVYPGNLVWIPSSVVQLAASQLRDSRCAPSADLGLSGVT